MLFVVTLRRVLVSTGLIGGLILTFFVLDRLESIFRPFSSAEMVGVMAVGAGLGALMGIMAVPLVSWLETRLQRTPLVDILYGAIGLILGLVIANLLGAMLSSIPWLGGITTALSGLILGYLGLTLASKRREEMTGLFGFLRLPKGEKSRPADGQFNQSSPKILDTSVIIDGRVADICKTGFIEGPIVIPGFVLEELRHVADSGDNLKRNRGRRGLDILNRIQKELDIPVQIYDREVGPGLEVDDKLIRLAKALSGKVITNDYNLNKVAALQNVPVLNINELANAVKPVVLPGEEMTVNVIRDGKEPGQGVAYLDDGTMIVIDGGKRHIGETLTVVVTSVLQTSAGRMIFARPKPAEKSLEKERAAT